jgi:hypothetical protein
MASLSSVRPSSNGHSNSNRLTASAPGVTVYTLPAWPNAETARVFSEVLYNVAMGDYDAEDTSAEALQQHFDAEYWIVQNAEQLIRAALERYLAGVDWSAIAEHVKAFAQAHATE